MSKRLTLVLLAPFFTIGALAWRGESAGRGPAGRVIIVKTVEQSATSFRFEPANITVLPGDTVRFIQQSTMPHNVEFIKSPPGTKLGATKVGPYLVQPNQTYDVVIDARFQPGTYQFICTPHVSLGMKGTISVATHE